MRHRFPFLTLAGAGAMSQSTSTATNGTLTTSFFFPGGANAMMSPVASVIGVNDTFTDITTYLIKCASPSLSASASASPSISSATTPAPTTTAPFKRRTAASASPTSTSTYSPETWDDDAYGDSEDSSSSSDLNSIFCALPSAGETLVLGPGTMNLLYTSSGTTDDMSCSIIWASSASASATAVSASATATASADAHCYMHAVDPGANIQAIQNAHYPDAEDERLWPTLLVAAGLEKLRAAGTSATATMDTPTITGAADEAASTGAAAAVRFDFPTAMGVVGAAGVLAAALAL